MKKLLFLLTLTFGLQHLPLRADFVDLYSGSLCGASVAVVATAGVLTGVLQYENAMKKVPFRAAVVMQRPLLASTIITGLGCVSTVVWAILYAQKEAEAKKSKLDALKTPATQTNAPVPLAGTKNATSRS